MAARTLNKTFDAIEKVELLYIYIVISCGNALDHVRRPNQIVFIVCARISGPSGWKIDGATLYAVAIPNDLGSLASPANLEANAKGSGIH